MVDIMEIVEITIYR